MTSSHASITKFCFIKKHILMNNAINEQLSTKFASNV